MTPIPCLTCSRDDFPDFEALALHIFTEHTRRNKWAAKVICKVTKLDKRIAKQVKRENQKNRVELTDQEKQNKRDSKTELSGVERQGFASCPNCKQRHHISIPVEYLASPYAWRKDKVLQINCAGCRR
jgi:hypothetical protein